VVMPTNPTPTTPAPPSIPALPLDVDAFSHRVLGPYCAVDRADARDLWPTLSDAEREEITLLLGAFLRHRLGESAIVVPELDAQGRVVDVTVEGARLSKSLCIQAQRFAQSPNGVATRLLPRLRRKVAAL